MAKKKVLPRAKYWVCVSTTSGPRGGWRKFCRFMTKRQIDRLVPPMPEKLTKDLKIRRF